MLKDFSLNAVVAGFVAVLVGFTSSVVIVFQAAAALGATPEQQPEYIVQLRGYVGAVLALQPGEAVRAALISGQGRLIDCTDRL